MKLAESGEVEAAYHLTRCLRTFCSRLAELREATPGFADWQDLYLDMELRIAGVEIDRTGLLVAGRVDAVRASADHGVVVVDYKLSQGGQVKHDLLQLAIYGHILEASRPNLSFTGLLEYYDPDLTCIEASPAELRSLFAEMVLPVVHEIASASASGSSSPVPTQPAESDEPNFSTQLVETFADFRLEIEVLDRVIAPQLVRYKVRPAPGVKVVSLAAAGAVERSACPASGGAGTLGPAPHTSAV